MIRIRTYTITRSSSLAAMLLANTLSWPVPPWLFEWLPSPYPETGGKIRKGGLDILCVKEISLAFLPNLTVKSVISAPFDWIFMMVGPFSV